MLPSCESNLVCSSTPLLHCDLAAEAAAALWEWLDRSAWSMACWENLELDSQAWRLLRQQIDDCGRRWWVRHEFLRATMARGVDDGDWLAALSRQGRDEYRRNRHQLEAVGELQVKLYRNLEDFDLVSRFLELEERGGNARPGRVVLARPGHAAFLDAVMHGLGERNELFCVEVRVEDRPVSIAVNLVDGTTVFGFKTTHDPALEKASPGKFNTFEVLRLVRQDLVLAALDSGAVADVDLLRRWPDSRPVGTVVAATRGFAGAAILSMMPAARWTRHEARRLLGRLRPAHGAVTA